MSATLHVFKEVVATGCTKTTMRLPATGTIFVLSKITSIYLISPWKNEKYHFIFIYTRTTNPEIYRNTQCHVKYMNSIKMNYFILSQNYIFSMSLNILYRTKWKPILKLQKIASKLPKFYIQQLIFMHFVLAWKLVYKYEFFVRLVKDKITSAINNWKIVSSTINVSPPTQRSC